MGTCQIWKGGLAERKHMFPLFSGPVHQGWVPLCTCWSPVRACGLILKIMEFLGSHIHVKGLSSSIYKFFSSDFWCYKYLKMFPYRALRVHATDWMFVSPPNPYVEILPQCLGISMGTLGVWLGHWRSLHDWD